MVFRDSSFSGKRGCNRDRQRFRQLDNLGFCTRSSYTASCNNYGLPRVSNQIDGLSDIFRPWFDPDRRVAFKDILDLYIHLCCRGFY